MSSRGPEAQREALEWWREKLTEIDSIPKTEAFDLLGSGLRKLPRQNIFQLEEKWPVYEAIKTKMLSMPGHAEYYAGEIEKAKAEARDITDDRDYYDKICRIFETLEHMPSEETVNVLGRYVDFTGDLLGEEQYKARMIAWARQEANPYLPLSHAAMRTLNELAIENGPTGENPNYFDRRGTANHDAWREWWGRVKTGKLSYKFEGDDRIYPTGTKAPPYAGPERGPPGSRDRVRGEVEWSAGAGAEGGGTGGGRAEVRHLWPWMAGIVVLATAGWWWWRGRTGR